MKDRSDISALIEVYRKAYTVETKHCKFTTVNELTDQTPALTQQVLWQASEAILRLGSIGHPAQFTKLLSEDDKGAILAGITAFRTLIPLAMARKYSYEIPGSIIVDVDMEYDAFKTTVNGIEAGDKVLVIDDTLATGGTVAGLVEAVRQAGAEVKELRVVTEKIGYGGREKLEAMDVVVRSVLGIEVDSVGAIRVVSAWGLPV